MLGGFPPIATALVVIAGLFGVIFGYPLFRVLKIRSPIARGITMGAISHALGVVKANEISHKEGAFSSLALVICGIFTVLIAPWLFEWVQWCFQKHISPSPLSVNIHVMLEIVDKWAALVRPSHIVYL